MNNERLLILAGGQSSRMGSPKGLLWNTTTKSYWLTDQCQKAQASGLHQGVVVIGGRHAEDYQSAVPELPYPWAINEDASRGSFSSLITGLQNILQDRNAKWIWILPVDVPFIRPEDVSRMREAYAQNPQVIRPQFRERTGHPVILGRDFAISLCEKSLFQGPEQLKLNEQIRALPKEQITDVLLQNPVILQNLNTPSDFAQFLTNS